MIAPIALQALELKDQGISIKVENDKLVITRDDGNDVKINCIYTKDEIDSIITTGTLPNDLQTILLEALNDYIKSNISVNSITWNDKQLSQINITPNDLLNLISTLSANDSNIVKSLQQYTTTNDVETIITDRLDLNNDAVIFMQSIKDYLENQFLPSYQSKITYLDEETKEIKHAILELKQDAIEGESKNDFTLTLPDGTNMTFTNEEVAKILCMLINLSNRNNNNRSDAINEINNRQQTGLRVAADFIDIIDSLPTKNDDEYVSSPHIPTPTPDVFTDEYKPFQPNANRLAKFNALYNDLCTLLNSTKPHIVKFALRLYNGTYQLVAYVLETAYEHISQFTNLIVIPVSKQLWDTIKEIDYYGLLQQMIQFCNQQLNRLQDSVLVKYLLTPAGVIGDMISNAKVEELTFNVGYDINENNINCSNYSICVGNQSTSTIPIKSNAPNSMTILPQFLTKTLYKGHTYSFMVIILPTNKVCTYEWIITSQVHPNTKFTGNTLYIDVDETVETISFYAKAIGYEVYSKELTYELESIPPALPTPEPIQIIISFPQHQSTLEKGGQYNLQAHVIPETAAQSITWSLTGEHDDNTTIENDILTISSTETNSVLNITAKSIDTQLTIEIIPIDPLPREVPNIFIFGTSNPPRIVFEPWMDENFNQIDYEQWELSQNYVLQTDYDNAVFIIHRYLRNELLTRLFGSIHPVHHRENDESIDLTFSSARNRILTFNNKKYKCSNIHGFMDIGVYRFSGYIWLLQTPNEPKIQLLSEKQQVEYIQPTIDTDITSALIDSYNNTVEQLAEHFNDFNKLKDKVDNIQQPSQPIQPTPTDTHFTLKESSQLYLYKPSSIGELGRYYRMTWNIDSNYNIPLQTNFGFMDYLYGHTWSLIWDGEKWSGNDVVNLSFAKQSTYNNNHGRPAIIVHHTEEMAKWINCIYDDGYGLPPDYSSINFANFLAAYIENWRVVYNDGTIKELPDAFVNMSEAPTYELNGIKVDEQQMTVKVSNITGDNMLYIMADLKVGGYTTQLKWDCHPQGGVSGNYLNPWNDNPVIERFNYRREYRNHIPATEELNPRDIHIYIEKSYFEQTPQNADNTFNPFEQIVAQQFYEVRPDPRNCTTLSTDYNIYSSKIIWADNIMTMRRDLNVVGGITDTLTYDYSLLKQIVDGIQEQMRLQAVYNEYTASIQKGLTIANTILQVLASAISIASALSTCSMSSERMELNTYRTEDFHFPGTGGSGGSGGSGGGFPGTGGDFDIPDFGDDFTGNDFPIYSGDVITGKPNIGSNVKDPISGQFLLNMDATANGQIFRRFIPTTTEITTPALGAFSSLTASNLTFAATNLFTTIGNSIASLTPNRISLIRYPEPTEHTQIQYQHSLTDSQQQINEYNRTTTDYTITDDIFAFSVVLSQLLDDDNLIQLPNGETRIEPLFHFPTDSINQEYESTQLITSPRTQLTHTTTTNISTTQQVPVITDTDGTDYTLEQLSNLTYQQIYDMVQRIPQLSITFPLFGRHAYNFNVFYNDQPIFERRHNQNSAISTPSHIQYTSRLHRPTTSQWQMDDNGTTLTARFIEQLSNQERYELNAIVNSQIVLVQGGNQDTGESWTEIRSNTNELLAKIDYEVPVWNTFTGDHITIETPYAFTRLNADGLIFNTQDENGFERVMYDKSGMKVSNESHVPTKNEWTLPGSNPTITATDIELMNEDERTNLMNTVNSHGNVMSFNHNADTLLGTTWTEIIYDGVVVATIDFTIHNEAEINSNGIIIGNPQFSQFSITQQGVRWIYNSLTGELPREEITLSGFIGGITASAISGVWNWARNHPGIAIPASIAISYYVNVKTPLGLLLKIPKVMMKLIPKSRLLAENENDEEELEYSLQPIIDWCTYDENTNDGTDMDITMENADEYAVSMKSCMQIAKSFRDTLKGPLALMCNKIQDIENNMNNIPSNPTTSTLDELKNIEQRITTLETKCANIHCESTKDEVSGLSSPITTGLLTLENLLKSYDDRLKILEAKCANIV